MQCPICLSDNVVLALSGHTGYAEGLFYDVYHCDNCYLAFVQPLVSEGSIYDAIYTNVRSIPGFNRYFEYAQAVKRVDSPLQYLSDSEESFWAVQESINRCKKRLARPVRVLDVGSGYGYLTYALRLAGLEAVGIDVSERACEFARRNYGNYYHCGTLQDLQRTKPEMYDIVLCVQVLEHVEDPVKLTRDMAELLQEGGQVILLTPNKSIFKTSVIWHTDLPPVHLYWFSRESLTALAKRLACEVEFIDVSEYLLTNHIYVEADVPSEVATRSVPVLNKQFQPIRDLPAPSRIKHLLRAGSDLVNLRPTVRSLMASRRGLVRLGGAEGTQICCILSRS